jgi:hypothetical protein
LHIVNNVSGRNFLTSAVTVNTYAAIGTKNCAVTTFAIATAAKFAAVYANFGDGYSGIYDVIGTACVSDTDCGIS